MDAVSRVPRVADIPNSGINLFAAAIPIAQTDLEGECRSIFGRRSYRSRPNKGHLKIPVDFHDSHAEPTASTSEANEGGEQDDA